MSSRIISLLVFLSGCAVAVGPDDTVDTTDAGKRPSSGDAGTMRGDPNNDNDSGSGNGNIDSGTSDPDSGTPIDSGSQQSNCGSPYSGVLATYDFTNEPGNQQSTPAKSTAPNVTATSVARSNTVTAVTGLNSINANNWAMTAKVDTTRYYTFTITPPGGCALDISSISVDTKTSSTGPLNGSIATSADAFNQQSSVSLNVVTKASLAVSGATKAVEVRVYGFNASSASGTWRIENTLMVSGALK